MDEAQHLSADERGLSQLLPASNGGSRQRVLDGAVRIDARLGLM